MLQFSSRSLEPSFGLLFKDLLDDLGVRTTGASVIASTLDSVVNFSGFFVAPVMKTFSYRKVCIVGSFICALGLLFTAPANSMAHIIATYSIFGGMFILLCIFVHVYTFVKLCSYYIFKLNIIWAFWGRIAAEFTRRRRSNLLSFNVLLVDLNSCTKDTNANGYIIFHI